MEQESKFLKIFARFSPPLLQSIFANFVELDCIDYCFLVASCNRQYEYIPKVSNPKLFLGKVVINRQKKGEDLPFEFFIFHSTKQLVWKLLKMSHLNFHDKNIMCSITANLSNIHDIVNLKRKVRLYEWFTNTVSPFSLDGIIAIGIRFSWQGTSTQRIRGEPSERQRLFYLWWLKLRLTFPHLACKAAAPSGRKQRTEIQLSEMHSMLCWTTIVSICERTTISQTSLKRPFIIYSLSSIKFPRNTKVISKKKHQKLAYRISF